jgi:hypothetical protein
MEASFKFYNVGQGTFYGGAIEHNGHQFVVVYDCGSVTARDPLVRSINEFRTEFDRIDLLIVSHFDSDHVNGIALLIGDKKRVERIILPYLPVLKRLVLVASQEVNDEDYASLVTNPTEFFTGDRFNIGDIVYIDQGGSNEGGENIAPDDNLKFDRELEEDFDFGEFFMELPESDEEAKEKILGDDYNLNGDNTRFLSFNTRLTVGAELWEFVFYHRKTSDETDITNFSTAIDQFCKDEGNIKVRELFTLERIKMVKKLYQDHIEGDVNYSSLCVFHQPMFRSTIGGYTRIMGTNELNSILLPWRWRHRRWRYSRSGTLLTGDQFLKKDFDFNPFYHYFNSRMNRTEIYQVPHHGSSSNWRDMPCELNRHDIGCYVINHGYINRNHPNPLVLRNLLTFVNREVVLNNEHTRLEYWMRPIPRRQ